MTAHETQDLSSRVQLPDDELKTQRFGQRCLLGGIILAALTFMTTEAVSIIAGANAWRNAQAALFGDIALTVLTVLAGALVVVGGLERLQRPLRTRQRALGAATQRISDVLQQVQFDGQMHYENVTALVGAVPGRLSATEHSLQALIAVLPDEIQRKYWAGYTDAARDGFSATGTDGRRRPPHIGLVHNDEE